MKHTKEVTVVTELESNFGNSCCHWIVGSEYGDGAWIDFDALAESETQKDDLTRYLLKLFKDLPDRSLRSFRYVTIEQC